MHTEQSPCPACSGFADYRIKEQLAQKAFGICTDCGLEDSDPTRFDGMYCTGCADYLVKFRK